VSGDESESTISARTMGRNLEGKRGTGDAGERTKGGGTEEPLVVAARDRTRDPALFVPGTLIPWSDGWFGVEGGHGGASWLPPSPGSPLRRRASVGRCRAGSDSTVFGLGLFRLVYTFSVGIVSQADRDLSLPPPALCLSFSLSLSLSLSLAFQRETQISRDSGAPSRVLS